MRRVTFRTLFALCLAVLAWPSLASEVVPYTWQDNVARPSVQKGVTPAAGDVVAAAAAIDFTPSDASHTVCPAYGACPPGSQTTTEYIDFGVDFTQFGSHPPVGVFDDGAIPKWGGVNGSGNLDLLTDTCARIVEPGTTTQGVTDYLAVAAGHVEGPSAILLEAYDAGGTLVGSSIGDDGNGTADSGDVLAVVDLSGTPVIASFCVSTPTADNYGVSEIALNTPTAAVPTVAPLGLVGLALLLMIIGGTLIRRKWSFRR